MCSKTMQAANDLATFGALQAISALLDESVEEVKRRLDAGEQSATALFGALFNSGVAVAMDMIQAGEFASFPEGAR